MLLIAALAGLGLWYGLGTDRAQERPGAVAPAASPAGEYASAEADGAPEPLREPEVATARDDAPVPDGSQREVELWVRLVESVVLESRTDPGRPVRRGVPGVSASWDGALVALSDADGLTRFTGLAPRAGELRVAPQLGFSGWSGTLDLAAPSGGLRRAGARLTFELELRPDLGLFPGRVLDASGAAVAGAWVALARGGTASRRNAGDADLLAPAVQSDAGGAFALPRVQGEERLELLIACARADLPAGHVRPLGSQELASSAELEVRLPAARAVRVRVLGHDGANAPGRLCLQRDGALWPADCEPRLARTGAARDGHARAGAELALALPDGPWVVHYLPERPGEPRQLFQFSLAPLGPTEFEFRLP